MGQGGYVFCEQDSIMKENSVFRAGLANLETQMILKCNAEWAPKTWDPNNPFGGNNNWGRTSIIPALFDLSFNGGTTGAQQATWRQDFTAVGHQLLIAGAHTGYTLAEDWKIAWAGLAFPNKNQHITEIRFQIGDRKYGRIDLEEMLVYNKPAIIFEEGFIIDEEQAFELHGYFQEPMATFALEGSTGSGVPSIYGLDAYTQTWQRIVMLGFAAYKFIDRALGNPGSTTGV